jgi:hypothetical protein
VGAGVVVTAGGVVVCGGIVVCGACVVSSGFVPGSIVGPLVGVDVACGDVVIPPISPGRLPPPCNCPADGVVVPVDLKKKNHTATAARTRAITPPTIIFVLLLPPSVFESESAIIACYVNPLIAKRRKKF